MDRQVLDDIYCFTEVIALYIDIQIVRLNNQVNNYKKEITQYNNIKINNNFNSSTISSLDYGITQNSTRIEFVKRIISDLVDIKEQIIDLKNKYYCERDFMASNYLKESLEQQQKQINDAFEILQFLKLLG